MLEELRELIALWLPVVGGNLVRCFECSHDLRRFEISGPVKVSELERRLIKVAKQGGFIVIMQIKFGAKL